MKYWLIIRIDGITVCDEGSGDRFILIFLNVFKFHLYGIIHKRQESLICTFLQTVYRK